MLSLANAFQPIISLLAMCDTSLSTAAQWRRQRARSAWGAHHHMPCRPGCRLSAGFSESCTVESFMEETKVTKDIFSGRVGDTAGFKITGCYYRIFIYLFIYLFIYSCLNTARARRACKRRAQRPQVAKRERVGSQCCKQRCVRNGWVLVHGCVFKHSKHSPTHVQAAQPTARFGRDGEQQGVAGASHARAF